MPTVKCTFFLPLRDNDGRALAVEIAEVRAAVFDEFDGWTHTGVVNGAYRMADGSAAYDESNAYFVVTDDSRVDILKGILMAFKARTTQEKLYFEVQREPGVDFL